MPFSQLEYELHAFDESGRETRERIAPQLQYIVWDNGGKEERINWIDSSTFPSRHISHHPPVTLGLERKREHHHHP
jgi:hypothetical protein